MTDSQLKAAIVSELSHYAYTFRFGKRLAKRLSAQAGRTITEARIEALAKDAGVVKVNGSFALASRLAGRKLSGKTVS